MKKPEKRISRYQVIRPGALIVVGVVIAAALVVLAWAGQRYTRKVIHELIAEKSSAFVERIENVGSLTWRAEERIESEIAERLLAAARTVVFLEKRGKVTAADLAAIADGHDVRTLHLVDTNGLIEESNHGLQHSHRKPRQDFRKLCRQLFEGTQDEQILGLHTPPGLAEPRFSVAVRRPTGGIIIVSIDATSLAQLRREIGFGRLVQDLGGRSDVLQVVVQDQEGIIAATPNVSEVATFDEDPFLAAAWSSGESATRPVQIQDDSALEMVKRIVLGGNVPVLVRIAVDSSETVELEKQTRKHFLVLIGGIAAFLFLSVYALVLYRDYRIVSRAKEQAETFSNEILQGMADSVLVVDAQDRVVLSNDQARKLFGPSPDQFPEVLREILTSVRTSSIPLHKNIRVADGDGPDRRLAIAASLVRVAGERPFAVLLVRDETEVRRLEQEVQRNEKEVAMGRLAGSVAHEVRNPLNAIGMTAQRLAIEFKPTEDQPAYNQLLSIVNQEVKRLDGIITQFLQFARSPIVDRSPGDLRDLIASVVAELTGVAKARDIELRLDGTQPTMAAFDDKQMRQVILNLLTNAIEASDAGATVDLAIRAEGSEVAFIVRDHGSGMTKEERERVFDLYYSTKERGTGLGLPIASRIVEAHDGIIDIQSEPGRGTTITVRFPRGV